MTTTIGLTEPGKGSGSVNAMFWDETKSKFVVSVKHMVGMFQSSTVVELDPDITGVVMFSNIIPGYLAEQEMRLLFELAQETHDPIVEIGSFMGKSTVCLGWGSRLGYFPPVFAVDPHRGSAEHKKYLTNSLGTFPAFTINMSLAGLEQTVVPLKITSREAIKRFRDETVGLVFIDGEHSQSSIDFDMWAPKVKPGGLIALHDSTGLWPTVEETVNTRIHEGEQWELEQTVVTTSVARKVEK